MKSRILSRKDYRDVVLNLPAFVPDQEGLERELGRLANPYIRWEDGGTAAEGDMAVCRLESECTKFRKEKVKFMAGSGMFHRELERLAVGMNEGDVRETDLPEGRVKMTLLSVKKRIVPELEDAMTEKLELPDVHTLAEYREYLLRLQREKALDEIAYDQLSYMKREVLGGSEFVLEKSEWKQAVGRELARCRAIALQDGLVLEEMTAEDFKGRIPVKSYHELVAMLQDSSWDDLCLYLLGCAYAQENGFSVGETEYEAHIADYSRMWRISEEQARAAESYEFYLFSSYSGYAYTVWRTYLREQYDKA